MLQRFKKYKWEVVLFLIIIPLGIFVRTYHFSDWLRFHKDEARDATLINNVIKGNSPLPLLGPVVGNTHFKLGPMFYYFQYASAYIFGNSADKLAYPDLIFSILSIGLLFFLLKKYFSSNISLLLTALFSITFYIVRYSRFAWNPNSQPFFLILFLYAFLQIASARTDTARLVWASVIGIVLGIGVQLHVLFLLSMPIVTLVFFYYLKKKKVLNWKILILIISITFLLNLPQFVSEIETHGKNTKELIKVVLYDPPQYGTPISTVQCIAHINTYILSITAKDSYCRSIAKRDSKNLVSFFTNPTKFYPAASIIILGLVFTIGGCCLLLYFARKEPDEEKKLFLHFLGIFMIVLFVVCLLVLNPMTMRYFVISEIIPFLLLGFWIKLILKMKNHFKLVITAAIILPLFLINISTLKKQASLLSGYGKVFKQDTSNLTLGEARSIARFIVANSGNSHVAYIDGTNVSLQDITATLDYLPEASGLKIKVYKENKANEKNMPLFGFDVASNVNTGANLSPVEKENFTIGNSATHGRFSMFKLVPK